MLINGVSKADTQKMEAKGLFIFFLKNKKKLYRINFDKSVSLTSSPRFFVT